MYIPIILEGRMGRGSAMRNFEFRSIAPVALALAILVTPTVSFGREFDWVAGLGRYSNYPVLYDLAVDGGGNVFTLGSFEGVMDVDPGPGVFNIGDSAGTRYLLRLEGSGQFGEVGQLGAGSRLSLGPGGFVHLAGSYTYVVDLDPSTSTWTATNQGGGDSPDAFVTKSPGSGGFFPPRFIVQFEGATSSDSFVLMAAEPDDQGNVVVAGSLRGTVDFDPGPAVANLTSGGADDAVVLKLDPWGRLIWARRVGASGSQAARSLALGPSGSIVVGGTFAGTVDFDPGTGVASLTSIGTNDLFVLTLGSSGDFVRVGALQGAGLHSMGDLRIDSGGSVYLTGVHEGTTDFDPGPGSYPITASTSREGFVVKLDGAGAVVWAEPLSSSARVPGLALDPNGGFFLAGAFSGTFDVNPGSGVWHLTSQGSNDIYLAEFDPSGSLLWAGSVGGAQSDEPNRVVVDAAGSTYVIGSFQDAVDFDPGPGTATLTSGSVFSSAAFVLKLSATVLDADGDGVPNPNDNCPSNANPDQGDLDGDLLGDVCDVCPADAANDPDADGICNGSDNCPAVANPAQTDADSDGTGDACDACRNDSDDDADADGICGDRDNCPAEANVSQSDADSDGLGDACDPCPDDPGLQDSRVLARALPGYASEVIPGPAGSLYWFGGGDSNGGYVARLDAGGGRDLVAATLQPIVLRRGGRRGKLVPRDHRPAESGGELHDPRLQARPVRQRPLGAPDRDRCGVSG